MKFWNVRLRSGERKFVPSRKVLLARATEDRIKFFRGELFKGDVSRNLWWDNCHEFFKVWNDPREDFLERLEAIDSIRKNLVLYMDGVKIVSKREEVVSLSDLSSRPSKSKKSRTRTKAGTRQMLSQGSFYRVGYLESWLNLVFLMYKMGEMRELKDSELSLICSQSYFKRDEILEGHRLFLSWERQRRFLKRRYLGLEREIGKIRRWQESLPYPSRDRDRSFSFSYLNLLSIGLVVFLSLNLLDKKTVSFIPFLLFSLRKFETVSLATPILNFLDRILKDGKLSRIRLRGSYLKPIKASRAFKIQNLRQMAFKNLLKILPGFLVSLKFFGLESGLAISFLLCWAVFRNILILRFFKDNLEAFKPSLLDDFKIHIKYHILKLKQSFLEVLKSKRVQDPLDPLRIVRSRKARSFVKLPLAMASLFFVFLSLEVSVLETCLTLYREVRRDRMRDHSEESADFILDEEFETLKRVDNEFYNHLIQLFNWVVEVGSWFIRTIVLLEDVKVADQWGNAILFSKFIESLTWFRNAFEFIGIHYESVRHFKSCVDYIKIYLPLNSLALAWKAVYQRYGFPHNFEPTKTQDQLDWLESYRREADFLLDLWTDREKLQRSLRDRRKDLDVNVLFQGKLKRMEQEDFNNGLETERNLISYKVLKERFEQGRDVNSSKFLSSFWKDQILSRGEDSLKNIQSRELEQSFWAFNGKRADLIFKGFGISFLLKINFSLFYPGASIQLVLERTLSFLRSGEFLDMLKEFYSVLPEIFQDILGIVKSCLGKILVRDWTWLNPNLRELLEVPSLSYEEKRPMDLEMSQGNESNFDLVDTVIWYSENLDYNLWCMLFTGVFSMMVGIYDTHFC